MPVKMLEGIIPHYIEIGMDAITIAPLLRARPKGGVRVMFRFEFSDLKEGSPRHLVGVASLWDDGSDEDYPSAENLKNENNEVIIADNFLKHWKYVGSLKYLFRVQSGEPGVLTMDELILGEVLEWFLNDHKITASISPTGTEDDFLLAIEVNFERNGASIFDFMFFVENHEIAKDLFDYRAPPKRVA